MDNVSMEREAKQDEELVAAIQAVARALTGLADAVKYFAELQRDTQNIAMELMRKHVVDRNNDS